MPSFCRALVLIVLAVRVGAAGDGDPTAGEPLADLVIQGLDRPLRLRVHASHDGLPWSEFVSGARSAQLQSLFEQLDADADGKLVPDEARRLPRPEALGRAQPSADVNVAFNFRVLDADGDGAGTPAELQEYLAEFTRPGPALGFVEARIDRFPGDLFPALDANRDRALTIEEWSEFLKLLDRDRDGNRVLTPDELRSPSAELFGPEFLAVPIAQRSPGAQPPLTVRLEPPGPGEPDGVVGLQLVEAGHASAPLTIALQLHETAQSLGIHADSVSPQGVRLRIGRRFLELACVPSGNRVHSALSAALLRQYEALAERLGRPLTASDELPTELRSAFSVADADGNGSLERSELERSISGFIAATASSTASRMSVMFVLERRALSTGTAGSACGSCTRCRRVSPP
jgi:Ca2+-binding EF-hand superfamily protein